jgi:hypothetical protein
MNEGALERTRSRFRKIAGAVGLLEADVSVVTKPLTPEEAIGTPGRRDFAILSGRERVVEAHVCEGSGHAFTDIPREFLGRLAEVIEIEFEDSGARAIYAATLNAVLSRLGRVERALHCRDEDPELCGVEIAAAVRDRLGKEETVGLIGFNPAIAERLAEAVGTERLFITDLNPENVGQEKFGVEVWDGASRTDELIDASDLVLITGTTLTNGTFDRIWERVWERGRVGLLYGVTAAGVCALLGLERICPRGR